MIAMDSKPISLKYTLLLALAFAALAGSPTTASPSDSLFDDFQGNCAAHLGDAVTSLNEVAKQGWKLVPQDKLTPPPSPGLKITWERGYAGVKDVRSVGLVAGRAEMFSDVGLKSVPVSICMVVQNSLDPASLDRVGKWTGGPATMIGENEKVYFFTSTTSGNHFLAPIEVYHHFQRADGHELITITDKNKSASEIMIVTALAPEVNSNAIHGYDLK
jgi:hypothetical protein